MAVELTDQPVAPVRVMAWMKVALLRHSLQDPTTASWIKLGAWLGVLLAAGTIWTAGRGADALAGALALWLLGWLAGPLVTGGGDDDLRPEYFVSSDIGWRRTGVGMLLGACIGVAPAVTLLGSLGLVVFGAGDGWVPAMVAVPAALTTALMCLVLSKTAVTLYGFVLRTQAGALLAGLATAFVLAFTAQGWALVIAFVSYDVAAVLGQWARVLPSGWGLVAVEAATRGDWMLVVAGLAGLVLVTAAAFWLWVALLARRSTGSMFRVRPRRMLTARDGRGAALAKELRSHTRDLAYSNSMAFALGYAVFFCLMPLAVGWTAMVPWVGPAFAVMATAVASNQYGNEGTNLWLVLSAPGAEAEDVRARQRLFLIVVAPLAIGLTLALTPVADRPEQWPFVLAALPALLGGGAGLTVLLSVYAVTPTTDPHKRAGNPLSTGGEVDASGNMYVALFGVLLLAAPAVGAAAWWGWWGTAVGVLVGVVAWGWFGRLARQQLRRRGVEMLTLMRHGRPSYHRTGEASGGIERLTDAQRRLFYTCIGVGAVLVFPQGLVPVLFLATGVEVESWFLAMHLASPWRWPVALGMAFAGLLVLGFGARVYTLRGGPEDSSEFSASSRSRTSSGTE